MEEEWSCMNLYCMNLPSCDGNARKCWSLDTSAIIA
nr:MAG TPA: hypothetical protein [Caudoviricetes sp.]